MASIALKRPEQNRCRSIEVPVTSLIFLGAIKPIVGKGISIRTQQYKEF